MDFKIEKNIPIPPVDRGKRRKQNSISRVLDALKINESFVVPIPEGTNPLAFRNQIGYAKSIIKKKPGDVAQGFFTGRNQPVGVDQDSGTGICG